MIAAWMKTSLTCFALAVAFVAGYLSGSGGDTRTNPAAGDFRGGQGLESLRIEDVRAEIDVALAQHLQPLYAELAAHRAVEPMLPAAEAVPPVTSSKAVSSKATPQFELAMAFVEERLAYGTWTEEDQQAFRGTIQGLTAAEADTILGALFGAMNDGRIEVRTDGPPF